MDRHDRQRLQRVGWLTALLAASTLAVPAAAQHPAFPYEAIDNALTEAARAREEGNCLAHGQAVAEANRLAEAWIKDWGPVDSIEQALNNANWAGIFRKMVSQERDQRCGEVEPVSDDVMADVPSAFLPGMHETRQAAPPELEPVLDTHNAERAAVGAPPLEWNAQLQASATEWAKQLATLGRLEHAPREGRGTERENLQQLLPGTDPEDMLEGWLSEKADFVPGVFPDVSRSDDWNVISHYSQMIWRDTTDLGCGVASGSGFDWLVCRYNPGGNKPGERVGLTLEGVTPAASSSPPPAYVRFDIDANRITPMFASMLDDVAEEYKRTGKAALQIQSNATDSSSGSLLFDRLENVQDYLTSRGVPESALTSGDVAITFGRD